MFMRKVKSFVCRNRHLTKNQQELISDFYPKYGLSNSENWDFATIFGNTNPVIIEIGFGTGDTLIKNAVTNPNVNYIGIEVYQAGCINILNYLKEHQIENLRICQGDAKEILEKHIKPKSLSGVQIYFPDPWPKKRHYKRRLIQNEFVNLLASRIVTGGSLHLATDWENYAEHMLEVLNNNQNFENQSNTMSYMDVNRELTKFEQKGIDKGHIIRDILFEIVA